jgi:preprotein translocase subunit SecG
MTAVILVIHIILAIALILLILLQQSEGGLGGLGGGGGGGMGGFMTGRATANLLTRATAVLAGLFFVTSMGLALLADQNRRPSSILDMPGPANQSSAPAKPVAPAVPAAPSQ